MYFSESKIRTAYYFLMVIILSIAFYNLFYGLSKFPIFSWDEARHGVSAYEMLKKKNFIVNTYRNKIDYWNLKPPLSFWTTIIGYKIAGFNTLGLRLPSAVFSWTTVLMVTIFVHRRHGMLASLIASLALATSSQFLINHSARTGDADSLYVFLFTAAMLALLMCENSIRWLYISGFAFSLAFLTKSWHAGNIIMIIIIYLLFTGMFKRLSLRKWILLFLCTILPILAWGIVRYQYDGFLFFKNMISYDLLKRSSTTIEGHFGTRLYYWGILWRFSKLWVIYFLSLLLLFMYKQLPSFFRKPKNFYYIIGICLWALLPFTLYSIAETKIRWYILPIYPPLSIIIGALSARMMDYGNLIAKTALAAFILFCSLSCETEILNYIQHPLPKLQVGLVQKLQGLDEIKGYNLFKYHHTKRVKWQQNAVLAAELYGDFHVENGDFSAFINNNKGLLLIKKGRTTKQIIRTHQLSVLVSNRWGYIVCKKEIAAKLHKKSASALIKERRLKAATSCGERRRQHILCQSDKQMFSTIGSRSLTSYGRGYLTSRG